MLVTDISFLRLVQLYGREAAENLKPRLEKIEERGQWKVMSAAKFLYEWDLVTGILKGGK